MRWERAEQASNTGREAPGGRADGAALHSEDMKMGEVPVIVTQYRSFASHFVNNDGSKYKMSRKYPKFGPRTLVRT